MMGYNAWRNTDSGSPMPAWLTEVAVHLHGGRFAVETRQGTVVAEMGDWIIRTPSGRVEVAGHEAFVGRLREAITGAGLGEAAE